MRPKAVGVTPGAWGVVVELQAGGELRVVVLVNGDVAADALAVRLSRGVAVRRRQRRVPGGFEYVWSDLRPDSYRVEVRAPTGSR